VTWSTETRCGLQFSGSVDVRQWQACPSNAEQERVDEVVRLVKAGAVPLPVPALGEQRQPRKPSASADDLPRDLERVMELLAQMGEELAGDPEIILQHGTALQNLDIASQLIDAIRELVTGHDTPKHAYDKLDGLRRSADQALLR